jgi:hypothetical protein
LLANTYVLKILNRNRMNVSIRAPGRPNSAADNEHGVTKTKAAFDAGYAAAPKLPEAHRAGNGEP